MRVKKNIYLFILLLFVSFCGFAQPTTISGLQLWVNADNVVLSSGSSIQQLTDLSGNNNHPEQLDNSKQAQLVLNTINGLPVISFDGVNDYFSLTEINNARTIFLIMNESSMATNDYRPILGHSNFYDFHRGDNKNFWSSPSTSGFITSGITKINSVQVNGTNTVVPNYFSLIEISTTSDVRFDNISIDRLLLGRSWFGEMAEIIVFNRQLTPIEVINIEDYLYNKYATPVSLGADINQTNSFCPITLDAGSDFTSYTWSTGATTSSIAATTSGTYSVITTDIFGRLSTDEIVVNFPAITLKPNTTVCYNTEFRWNTLLNTTDYNFAWSNGDTDSQTFFNPTVNTTLNCVISDLFTCSYTTPVITITVDDFSQTATLGPDVALCEGNSIGLISSSIISSYNWLPGNFDTATIEITNAGTYSVQATNNLGCEVNDEIVVSITGAAPTADFTFNTTCFGSNMELTSLALAPSGNTIVSYTWGFGEPLSGSNNESFTQNPLHNYLLDGNYDVSLEVETEIGCKQSITKQVTVYPLPVVDFLNFPACANASTQFKDLSDGVGYPISQWNWDFGDLTSASNTANVLEPMHQYNAQSTYLVSLTVSTLQGCQSSHSKLLYVNPSPAVDFINTHLCLGSVVTFTNTSAMPFPQTIQNWLWNFGDGQTGFAPIELHTYSSAGSYDVSLAITSSIGCTHIITKTVLVTPYPQANFAYTNYCLNNTTTFEDKSNAASSVINSWRWKFNNSIISTLSTAAYLFNTVGNKNIELTVANTNGCENSVTKTIVINPLPIASFSYSPNFVTPGESILFANLSQNATSYTWNFKNGFSSSLFQPNTFFPDSGLYVVNLVAKDKNGCKDSISKSIEVLFSKLDLGIFALKAEVTSDNFLEIASDLINYGTQAITSFKLQSSVNSESTVRETWNGELKRGKFLAYQFTSSVQLDAVDTVNAYVCVEITEVNSSKQDEDITNNKKCIAFKVDRFIVLPGFPNPAENGFTLPIILPEEGDVTIEVFNDLGELVFNKYTQQGLKGLNNIIVDINYLENGVYFYRVNFKDKIARNRFMVIK